MKRWLVVYRDLWEPFDEHRVEVTFHDDRQFQGPEAAAWDVAQSLSKHYKMLRIEDLT